MIAEFGLDLCPLFQMLSRRALSAGDSERSTFGLEPPLLSLWKLKPRERSRPGMPGDRPGEVGGWSMLMVVMLRVLVAIDERWGCNLRPTLRQRYSDSGWWRINGVGIGKPLSTETPVAGTEVGAGGGARRTSDSPVRSGGGGDGDGDVVGEDMNGGGDGGDEGAVQKYVGRGLRVATSSWAA